MINEDALRYIGVALLAMGTITAIGCAVLAYMTYHPFRRSKAAIFKMIGYTLLAFSLIIFMLQLVYTLAEFHWWSTYVRMWINTGAFATFDVGLIFLFSGMLDLYVEFRGMRR